MLIKFIAYNTKDGYHRSNKTSQQPRRPKLESMSNNNLLENPADLLRQVRENFIIEQDVESLAAIDEKASQIKAKSQEELRRSKMEISNLELQLKSKETRIGVLVNELAQVKDESQDLMGKNDLLSFVKQLDELEQSVVQLRSELDERIVTLVKGQRSSTTASEQPSGELIDDEERKDILRDTVARANILKLKLYRSLGLVIDDANGQVFIEKDNSEIDTLPLDNDLSDFFRTKYIWDRIKANR
ncbi:hypothetical protein HG536_0A03590 [Torulaspora globosa]|uniref:Kinetochore protein Spc24 n=1 Tax=Torulaspora globosa TaxID=48254 RepID=A0A7G3ZAK5_9SACH|nr:uncharacterized protein HG536_0A03590 [Torulaspora globosa]QLL30541.1 hypothetical protein HG536_0A03590 [Torulaspora globosa]